MLAYVLIQHNAHRLLLISQHGFDWSLFIEFVDGQRMLATKRWTAQNMANILILIIDDEIETIDLVGMGLTRCGYEVIGATSGLEGLDLIRTRKPALLLLDLMMPQLSGYDVCRQLRADSETTHLPIIILSASSTVHAANEALAAGANRFASKPVGIKQLAGLIESTLSGAEKQ